MAVPRKPAYLGEDEVEVGRFVLGPCERLGTEGDWWGEQHAYCTGSHHTGPGAYILCICECHVGREDQIVFPSPIQT